MRSREKGSGVMTSGVDEGHLMENNRNAIH